MCPSSKVAEPWLTTRCSRRATGRSRQSKEAVRAAGGKVVQVPFAFLGGRRFHHLDPSGNELAVWSPE